MIRVDSSKCMGCGQCAAICPTGNIQIRGAKAEVLGNCMNCGHCYAICPAQAVQMPPEAGCAAQEQPDAARIEAADFLQLVRSRRSIRKYKPRPVEEALLAEILEAGRYMATAGNSQSVRYLVIQKEAPRIQAAAWESLRRVVETMQASPDASKNGYLATMQRILRRRDKDPRDDRLFFGAPVILLVLSPSATDGPLAAASIELMAHASGLGALYCGFAQFAIAHSEALCRELGIVPEQLQACLLLGYPAVKFLRTPPRKAAQVRWM